MITEIQAIGQFQILFLAASQTQRIPVKTPHHSNNPVPKRNWFMLSANSFVNANIFQMYKIHISFDDAFVDRFCQQNSPKTKNPIGNNPYRKINQTNYL